jgi:hypothetical protein
LPEIVVSAEHSLTSRVSIPAGRGSMLSEGYYLIS